MYAREHGMGESEEDSAVDKTETKAAANLKGKRGRPTNAERTARVGNVTKIDGFLVKEVPDLANKTLNDIIEAFTGLTIEIRELKDQMQNNNNNYLKEVVDMKKEMNAFIDVIKEMRRERDEKENKWAKEKLEMRNKIGELENKVGQLENKVGQLGDSASNLPDATIKYQLKRVDRMLESQEKKDKINNIVIKGAQIGTENVKEQIERFLDAKLGVKRKVLWAAHRGSSNYQIIVARLENLEAKKEVFENKHKLRGSDIFIEQDQTRAEREIQRKVIIAAKEERKKGKEVKIGYHKLRVDGNWLRWPQETHNNHNAQDF